MPCYYFRLLRAARYDVSIFAELIFALIMIFNGLPLQRAAIFFATPASFISSPHCHLRHAYFLSLMPEQKVTLPRCHRFSPIYMPYAVMLPAAMPDAIGDYYITPYAIAADVAAASSSPSSTPLSRVRQLLRQNGGGWYRERRVR